jgi:cardiolipin-specific phospholipase
MGCSSREPYKVSNAEESVSYFVNFVEAWRKMKNITNFFMCGHSLGGYMAAIYSIKHPQHVKKLFLISPVGFSEKPKDFDIKRIEVVPSFDENGDEILNKGPP